MSKTQLSAEQERNLFNLFRKAIGVAGSYEDWFIEFARLYYTEASKAGMSGEQQTPEEVLDGLPDWAWTDGRVTIDRDICIQAMHEYAEPIQDRLSRALALLDKYETLEADIIVNNKCWEPEGTASTPTFTQGQWDTLIELQNERNNLLHPPTLQP